MILSVRRILRRCLESRFLAVGLGLLTLALFWPALNAGWQTDDHFHRARLIGLGDTQEARRPSWQIFDFYRADRPADQRLLEDGVLPWWTQEDLRLSMLRPVAGLSHGLDYRWWPERPRLMHLHSLLWFAASVTAALALYRRLFGRAWVAGLAALLFTLDDAHTMLVGWLSNRNALMALFFGLAALLAHDHHRRSGRRIGAWLAPPLLALAVLSNEGGSAAGAYLLAYALFLDRGRLGERLLALMPSAAVGLAWLAAYKLLGFGTHGSALYIDPGTDPGTFAAAATERLPLLIWGQFATPGAEITMFLDHGHLRLFQLLAVASCALLMFLLMPLLRRDPLARFFCLGMMLSLVPACATFPSDRLLFLAGVGGCGLLAQLLAAAAADAGRPLVRACAAVLAVIHLLLSPVALVTGIGNMDILDGILRRAAYSLPTEPGIGEQTAVMVNGPASYFTSFGPLLQALGGRPGPRRMLLLGSGIYSTEIERSDERTLAVRPAGGFLLPPGSPPPPGEDDTGLLLFRRAFLLFDGLYRQAPMVVGARRELPDATVEVTAVTADGRPAEATFRFRRALADPSHRWLRWQDGVWVPFEVPAVGEVRSLPPVEVPFPRKGTDGAGIRPPSAANAGASGAARPP